MSAMDAAVKTRPTGTGIKPLRHVYHKCTRSKNPRIAYCGHRSGPSFGVPYVPEEPDVCVVCSEMVKSRCTKCGEW